MFSIRLRTFAFADAIYMSSEGEHRRCGRRLLRDLCVFDTIADILVLCRIGHEQGHRFFSRSYREASPGFLQLADAHCDSR